MTIGVTHEVLIDGERSWVKFEAQGQTEAGQSDEDARYELSMTVNEGVLKVLAETVEIVRNR